MSAMASQITGASIFAQPFVQAQIKENVTGLCEGNSPVTGEFPAQMASNAGIVSFWWRHHDQLKDIGWIIPRNCPWIKKWFENWSLQ